MKMCVLSSNATIGMKEKLQTCLYFLSDNLFPINILVFFSKKKFKTMPRH